MIRDLQQDLGLVLFERRGTGLVPTSEALSLYAEVERAFVGLERIAQMATELRTRRAGFLRIAALPALANGFLPRFVGQFLQDRPKLDIVLSGLVSHAVVASVAQGQCDLGFAEASMEHAAVERELMPAAPFVAVLPERHRLARKKKLRPRDFEGENFISLGPSTLSRFRIDRVFAEHGITRILRIETPCRRSPARSRARAPAWCCASPSPPPSTPRAASSCVPSSRRSTSNSPRSSPPIAACRQWHASSSTASRRTSRRSCAAACGVRLGARHSSGASWSSGARTSRSAS